jgi:hypothetical protein
LRGIGWGPLFGQWWTLWTAISMMIWGGGFKDGAGMFLLEIVIYAVIYGFFGSVTGVIIALINPDDEEKVGGIVGIAVGLAVCGLEVLITHDPAGLVNVVFYFITGRFVGTGLAGRIMAPV